MAIRSINSSGVSTNAKSSKEIVQFFSSIKADLLIIAGGGGGGCDGYESGTRSGGGGGAGGIVYLENRDIFPGTYAVTVGAGGAGGFDNTSSAWGAQGDYLGMLPPLVAQWRPFVGRARYGKVPGGKGKW
jgi:hypothetical protein